MAPSAFPALKKLDAAQSVERAGAPAASKKRAQSVIATHMMKAYVPTDLSHPATLLYGSRCLFSFALSHASGVAQRLY
ncbi:hypothetical protein BN2476_310061 [Paraburkholderia piptadeniae]|uniref:Uncharacterized protein n=1 Tax=Paraburkholderia piptadeniae TaxID=1701573 RepID=A0A1N7S447_9BURK|nr:hypothetical protein BN2476_310061 [Paraburkholderia piptadeniae]